MVYVIELNLKVSTGTCFIESLLFNIFIHGQNKTCSLVDNEKKASKFFFDNLTRIYKLKNQKILTTQLSLNIC